MLAFTRISFTQTFQGVVLLKVILLSLGNITLVLYEVYLL